MAQNLSDFTAWLKKLFTAQETALIKKFSSTVPPYAIMWFKRTTAPAGWAICDGRQVSMEDGTVVTTPNLIDKYPLGATSSIGSAVEASIPNIKGNVYRIWGRGTAKSGQYPTGDGVMTWTNTTGTFDDEGGGRSYQLGTIGINASKQSSVYKDNATTVTPPSVKLLPCMKL